MSTARHSIKKDNIIKAVAAFYNADDVKAARKILFTLCDREPPTKGRQAKVLLDALDIYDLFATADHEQLDLPRFVADSFQALPPPTEFNELSNVILSFMSRIEELEKEMKKTREALQLDANSLEDSVTIKQELVDIKRNTMMLLGKNSNSGTKNLLGPVQNNNEAILHENSSSNNEPSDNRPVINPPIEKQGTTNSNPSPSISSKDNRNLAPQSSPQTSVKRRFNRQSSHYTDRNWHHSSRNWNYDRTYGPSIGTGTSMPGNRFRGSPKQVELYIGQCTMKTRNEDIVYHCNKHLSVEPISCDELNCRTPNVKSFKLTIDLSDLEYMLQPENWPRGVYVRRFISGKSWNNSNTVTAINWQDY